MLVRAGYSLGSMKTALFSLGGGGGANGFLTQEDGFYITALSGGNIEREPDLAVDVPVSGLSDSGAFGNDKLVGAQDGSDVIIEFDEIIAYALASPNYTQRIRDIIGAQVAGTTNRITVNYSSPNLRVAESSPAVAFAGAPTINDDVGDNYGNGSSWFDTTGRRLHRLRDNSSGAAKWTPSPVSSLVQSLLSGVWYNGIKGGYVAASLSADTLVAVPFHVPTKTSFTSYGLEVTTAATTGGLARIGIYTNKAGRPDKLVAGSELSLVTTSTGFPSGSITVTLEPGVYWFATLVNLAASFRCITSANESWVTHLVGANTVSSAVNTSGLITGVTVAAAWSTYGTGLPATFLAGSTPRNSSTPTHGLLVA
jgi:hypothetical protein